MPNLTLPDLIGQQIGKYKIIERKEEGSCAITYKASDISLGNAPVAIKVLKPTYQDANWKTEALKAAKVRDVPQIAYVIEVDENTSQINGIWYHLRYIVWEYVNGKPLKDVIQSEPITADFIVEIIRQLCLGIKAMQGVNLAHGDLHAGNILLVPPKNYEPSFSYRVKIVDFGLLKTFRGDKFKNDMEWIGILLRQLWNKNKTYVENMNIHNKKFNQSIPNLIKQLEDPSLERRLFDPIETINKLESLKELAKIEISKANGKLKHPFEYLSAEEMPENSDLLSYLYSDILPWYNDIVGFGTIVISGPRGCGKTMVLKNLRLQTKLMSEEFREKNFHKENYVGFYIHCHNSLYLPFAGIPVDYSKKKIQQLFIHYINILYSNEIVLTLSLIEELKLIDISTLAKENIFNFIQDKLFQSQSILFLNSDIFLHLQLQIEKEIVFIQNCIKQNRMITKCTSVSYLSDVCALLSNSIEYFKNKMFYFLLDDYSHPKVRFEVQKAFNRIIGVRKSKYCFKISSEKFSFFPGDYDLEEADKQFQQDREFVYIDLGEKYLSYPSQKEVEKKRFVESILDKRFIRAGLSERKPASLFGNYKFPSGNIAKSLLSDYKSKKTKKKAKQTLYAGLNNIYNLCAGDIATILQLCKEIYDKASSEKEIPKDVKKAINFELQDKIVRDFSKTRLDRIKEILTYGSKIYAIVETFGEISKKYLYEYGNITNEKDRYYEILRIEIVGGGNLSEKSLELYKKLLVEGIFTEATGRYPWGKGLLNNCLILRPIYTPALKITYRRRECLRLNVKRFEDFLLNPDKFKQTGTRFLKSLLSGKEDPTLFDYLEEVNHNKQPVREDKENE